MILHDYWRSSASYRVRIGLNLKRLAYRLEGHDLRTGEQTAADYRAKTPQGFVPALETLDGRVFSQSLAILEWLNETHPEPPFLPADADGRAEARAMALTIVADVHPLNNLRVLKALKNDFDVNQDAVDAWVRRWIAEGFEALEAMAARSTTAFLHGDAPGLADICLVPQWYNAERFATELAPYPTLSRIVAQARELPAFAAAHPDVQPDAG